MKTPQDREGMASEPGLFVIWSDARQQQSRILSALGERFELQRVLQIRWTPELVDENFARFYRGQTEPPYGAVFSHQKGRGSFTVVLVTDPEPRYELRDIPRGPAVVNANVLDAKLLFRQWTGGGRRVHGADTAGEAVRDTVLLLGGTPASHMRDRRWDGTIEHLAHDLAGSHGWSSLRELFSVLNYTVDYVVLRNFEALPADYLVGQHHDVDLLTDDYEELVRLLNGRAVLGLVPRWGGRFLVRVGGENVLFDIRFVGDDYYDEAWERRLLANRRLVRDVFYAPSDEDYFETLAYHAVIHKRKIFQDYKDRLAQMAFDLGRDGWNRAEPDSLGHLPRLVREIVSERGYSFARPRDVTVFFHYANAGMSHPWLRRKLAGLRREAMVRFMRYSAPVVRRYRLLVQTLVMHLPWLRRLRAVRVRQLKAR